MNAKGDELEALLSAYLDGELDAATAKQVAIRLERDPEARRSHEALRQVVGLVNSLPGRAAPPAIAEGVRRGLERSALLGDPVRRIPDSPKRSSKRFVWLACAASLGVVVSVSLWTMVSPVAAPEKRGLTHADDSGDRPRGEDRVTSATMERGGPSHAMVGPDGARTLWTGGAAVSAERVAAFQAEVLASVRFEHGSRSNGGETSVTPEPDGSTSDREVRLRLTGVESGRITNAVKRMGIEASGTPRFARGVEPSPRAGSAQDGAGSAGDARNRRSARLNRTEIPATELTVQVRLGEADHLVNDILAQLGEKSEVTASAGSVSVAGVEAVRAAFSGMDEIRQRKTFDLGKVVADRPGLEPVQTILEAFNRLQDDRSPSNGSQESRVLVPEGSREDGESSRGDSAVKPAESGSPVDGPDGGSESSDSETESKIAGEEGSLVERRLKEFESRSVGDASAEGTGSIPSSTPNTTASPQRDEAAESRTKATTSTDGTITIVIEIVEGEARAPSPPSEPGVPRPLRTRRGIQENKSQN